MTMRILESIGKFLGRLFVMVCIYGIYKLCGFETTVIIVLGGIFVNTNPDKDE